MPWCWSRIGDWCRVRCGRARVVRFGERSGDYAGFAFAGGMATLWRLCKSGDVTQQKSTGMYEIAAAAAERDRLKATADQATECEPSHHPPALCLASFYGRDSTVGQELRRMRCSGACGGRVGAAWLVTGPMLSARVRPRRVALLGPESRE